SAAGMGEDDIASSWCCISSRRSGPDRTQVSMVGVRPGWCEPDVRGWRFEPPRSHFAWKCRRLYEYRRRSIKNRNIQCGRCRHHCGRRALDLRPQRDSQGKHIPFLVRRGICAPRPRSCAEYVLDSSYFKTWWPYVSFPLVLHLLPCLCFIAWRAADAEDQN